MNENSNAPTLNPNKALWEKGDFTKMAETMRKSGSDFVEKLGINKGMKVLDVGCGDGTTAIPAARKGAIVQGVDIARNLVEAGNRRIKEEGLSNISFREGDVTNLEGIPDNNYDLVISIFGAMFAPRPFDVAREMVRVTRKGGKIIMGNWIPNDPTLVAQILKIVSAYTPAPPEGFVSPMLWGKEDQVIERFSKAGIATENISFEKENYTFLADISAVQFLERFRNYYGPTMNAFEAAEKNGKTEELQKELEELFIRENKSVDPNKISIPATFLKVTVVK